LKFSVALNYKNISLCQSELYRFVGSCLVLSTTVQAESEYYVIDILLEKKPTLRKEMAVYA